MTRKRQGPAAVRFVVLVLCAALCAWGLQAKLPGYKASNQFPRRSHPAAHFWTLPILRLLILSRD